MLIYIALVALILILPLFKINRKIYCIIIGTAMTLIVGFRDIYMGMEDTSKIYISLFDQLSNMSFIESYNFIRTNDIEVVFYMMTRIYLFFTNNVRMYLLLLAIPLNYAISRLIYKYSKMPSLSFIMFFSLNYFAFSFTLIRHCIALAFLIISYDYLYKKDLKKFLLTVFIAGLFHRTAWIFAFTYLLVNIDFKTYRNIICILVSLLLSCTVGGAILEFIFNFIQTGHYVIYANPTTNTLTFFCINFAIFVFIIIFCKKYKNETESNLLMNIYTIGICASSCMIFISEAFRISTFFNIFSIILLPNALKTADNKYAKFIITIIYICFIIYFFGFTIYNNKIFPYVLGTWNR